MVLVKVCGVRTVSDAILAYQLGADMIGLNFYPKSPRYLKKEEAKKIANELKGKLKLVGVFVNEEPNRLNELAKNLELDFVQLHGDEGPDYCEKVSLPIIKAIRLKDEFALESISFFDVAFWLVDSYTEGYGGSGKLIDLELARKAREKLGKIFLAGGLNPENVSDAIRYVKPYGVDVATGVESSPGMKDKDKMEKFFKAVKDATG